MSHEQKNPIQKSCEKPNSPAEENVDGDGSTRNPKRSRNQSSGGLGSSSNRPLKSDEQDMHERSVQGEDREKGNAKDVTKLLALLEKVTLEAKIKSGLILSDAEQLARDEAEKRVYLRSIEVGGVTFDEYKSLKEGTEGSLFYGAFRNFFSKGVSKNTSSSSNVSDDRSSTIGGVTKAAVDFQKVEEETEERSTQEESEGSRRN